MGSSTTFSSGYADAELAINSAEAFVGSLFETSLLDYSFIETRSSWEAISDTPAVLAALRLKS